MSKKTKKHYTSKEDRPAILAEIDRQVKDGMPLESALSRAGISKSTLGNWRRAARVDATRSPVSMVVYKPKAAPKRPTPPKVPGKMAIAVGSPVEIAEFYKNMMGDL